MTLGQPCQHAHHDHLQQLREGTDLGTRARTSCLLGQCLKITPTDCCKHADFLNSLARQLVSHNHRGSHSPTSLNGCRDTGIAYAILGAVFREIVYYKRCHLTLTWSKVDEETATLIKSENLTSAQVKESRRIGLAWLWILTEFTIQNTTNMSIYYHFSGVVYGCAALSSHPNSSRFYGILTKTGGESLRCAAGMLLCDSRYMGTCTV